MAAYWFIFLAAAWMALNVSSAGRARTGDLARSPAWPFFFVLLAVAIGFRREVGGDWWNYLGMVEAAAGESLATAMAFSDPAYAYLNWFGANVFGGVYFVNVVCAVLFTWGLLSFCRRQPSPWLALVVAVPYLVTVVAMGYSRQGVAIGLSMLGLSALSRGELWRFIGWVTLAAAFHRSAVILVPLGLFGLSRRKSINVLIAILTAGLLYALTARESIDRYVASYISPDLESSGAAIRVAMNALPAAVFLLFRRHFQMVPREMQFWQVMAWSALGFVPLLAFTSQSTAVDRIALYWIPLQLLVWSRLPATLGSSAGARRRGTLLVVAYSAAALLVWLVFATHAYMWVPYKSMLIENL